MASAKTCKPTKSNYLTVEIFREYYVRSETNVDLSAPSPPLSPVPVEATDAPLFLLRTTADQPALAVNLLRTGCENCLTDKQKHEAVLVADRLKALGDELNSRMDHRSVDWSALMEGFRNPDSSVLNHFIDCIKSAKEELSCQMIVKFFRLGACLVQSVLPQQSIHEEQHQRLLNVFVEFLTDEISSWIDDQGGWNNVLRDDQLRSQSTPVLTNVGLAADNTVQSGVDEDKDDHPFITSCPSPIIVYPRNERSQSVSIPQEEAR